MIFCSMYLDNFGSKFNLPSRNYSGEGSSSELGHALGKEEVLLLDEGSWVQRTLFCSRKLGHRSLILSAGPSRATFAYIYQDDTSGSYQCKSRIDIHEDFQDDNNMSKFVNNDPDDVLLC
ncbi:hypothetical protein ACH5RR_026247 [Cinchona calisaya]|uniref:Uncharacterized protein n=1 Tax=Cinchona calisaya TaxID=153742 RepID=A0ABD2Z214_9GENT